VPRLSIEGAEYFEQRAAGGGAPDPATAGAVAES
jgi:hypothetical protein